MTKAEFNELTKDFPDDGDLVFQLVSEKEGAPDQTFDITDVAWEEGDSAIYLSSLEEDE